MAAARGLAALRMERGCKGGVCPTLNTMADGRLGKAEGRAYPAPTGFFI